LKWQSVAGLLTCVFGLSIGARSQATPTASKVGNLQIGIGGLLVSTDYTPKKAGGLTVYGDFDFTKHIGIEGDIHFGSIITPADLGEDSYLLGPRFVIGHKRFSGYGKVLFGVGRLNYQQGFFASNASFTYKIYAFGGGLDIKATRRLNVRAIDVELQKWPGYGNGLSPIVTTVGVA
jgi:hypothetical protein